MQHILGLDVSTSCTGWTIIGHDMSILASGYVRLNKEKSSYKKAISMREVLCDLYNAYDISDVFIEENLQAFRPGLSSAKTLSTLARFNGIVSFLCFEIFNIEPVHLNVNHARKSLGIKIKRKKDGGAPTKQQVYEWVLDDCKTKNAKISFPNKTLKSGPRKGQVILDDASYDMADSYVIALAGTKSLCSV